MDGFLKQVAADLVGRYGDEVSSLSVLLPSRRAGLFFGEALAEVIDRPMWQPEAVTIDSLMEELSGLAAGDKLRLVAELYKIYVEFHPTESFDGFYSWGELLLGDFDSIDKYLIDADVLFSNLVDLHELDSRFDYLTDEQRAAIVKFWGSFGGVAGDGVFSPEQHDFLRVWRTLAPLYHRFRERLRESGIAYQGMVYREAAERIRDGRAPQIPRRHYVIAGFNALSRCEQVLFEYLQREFEVDFYWDYDDYFVGDTPLARAQEAGKFMRDNLRRFSGRLLSGGHDNFSRTKKIRSVAAGSDVLQCKYAGLRLAEIARQKGMAVGGKSSAPGKETAVVLCDEGLLTPLLWSMPPEVENVNITMGYPLRMHPAYTFVERLVELQNRRRIGRNSLAFYHSDVDGLARHPYLTEASGGSDDFRKSQYVYVNAERLRTTPVFEKIFAAPEGWRAMSDYLLCVIEEVARMPFESAGNGSGVENAGRRAEFFAIIEEHIRKLANSLDGCGIELSTKTYASLLRRSLQSVTVPFEGEPLAGVQVMGILETRALDFDNIIFLSVGDGNAPGNLTGAPSFIPYSLKMAYGLPTPEHHEGVYAYHFFRLMQRAKSVDLVWPSVADDKSAGQPSRYILQLDYESPHEVEKSSISVDVNLAPVESIVVAKDAKVMAVLDEFLTDDEPEHSPRRRFSPSLFYTYVECPLKFYFRGVARLRPDEEVTEEVDGAMFGNILHHAMRRLYEPLIGVADARGRILSLMDVAAAGPGFSSFSAVERAVAEAVGELYTKEENAAPDDWGGNIALVAGTIKEYIERSILPFDAGLPESFAIEKLEGELSAEFEFEFTVRGSADSGAAGGGKKCVVFHGIADRIDRLADGSRRIVDYKTGSAKNNASALLQMNLYSMMLRQDDVRTVLYYVREMSRPGYEPPVVETEPEFEEWLRETLAEMFDPAMPFTQCADRGPCEWCDFKAICQR